MSSRTPRSQAAAEVDSELTRRIGHGDHQAFESMMRRYNGRLFRVARAILKDDAEAEDALQDAYLHAYRHIEEFRGDAQIATWLTRIVINASLVRIRRKRQAPVVVSINGGHSSDSTDQTDVEIADEVSEAPTRATLRAEVRRLIEQRLDELPIAFRTVFVLRDVEDMSVRETAECLGISEATVRTRLFRARARLRDALARDIDSGTMDVFGFAGDRCDRIVAGVLARLDVLAPGVPSGSEPA